MVDGAVVGGSPSVVDRLACDDGRGVRDRDGVIDSGKVREEDGVVAGWWSV